MSSAVARGKIGRTDRVLRVAIESAPAELEKGLSVSETVCGLGEMAEQEGDVVRSRADWTTLSQLVMQLDQPAVASIDSALRRADDRLRELREKFSPAWKGRDEAVELRSGVAGSREGIQALRAAVAQVADAFKPLSAGECKAAAEGIAYGTARAQAAAARIGLGMRSLWEMPYLAGGSSGRSPGASPNRARR